MSDHPEPTFDIFAGAPGKNAVWLEAVRGLSNAREEMERIAAKTPGQYFIFSLGSRTILAQTETFAKPELANGRAEKRDDASSASHA